MSIPMGFEAGTEVQAIELLWELIPANEIEPLEAIVDEIDLRAYSLDVFEVESMTASAGPDILLTCTA